MRCSQRERWEVLVADGNEMLDAIRERDRELAAAREQAQREERRQAPARIGGPGGVPHCGECAAAIAADAPAPDHDCAILAWITAGGMRVVTSDDIRAAEREAGRQRRRELLSASRMTRPGEAGPLRDDDVRAVVRGDLAVTDALHDVREWLELALRPRDPGPPMLVLCGPPGIGKTVAAAWAIAEVGGRYVTLEEYLRDYARWLSDRTQSDTTSAALDRYDARSLVVLDEMRSDQEPRLAALERAAWHRLVDRRQSTRTTLTIALTNASGPELVRWLDARTADRMRGMATIKALHGESLRGRR